MELNAQSSTWRVFRHRLGQSLAHFSEPASDIGKRPWLAGFAAILLVGAAMRLWQLDTIPIWLDEAATLGFSRLPLTSLLFDQVDNHPPLHFLIMHAWLSVFPDLSTSRIPSALIGTASVAVIMLLARDQVSRRVSLIAGLVFALSTAQIYYSHEIRMYGLLVLGLLVGSWGALGIAGQGSLRMRAYMALYVAGGAIAIYSQIIGLLAMAVIGLGALAARFDRGQVIASTRTWLAANIILFVITLPWLVQIPALSNSFPGLPGSNDLGVFQWHMRNGIGYPGLSWSGNLQRATEALLILGSLFGAAVAYLRGYRAAAFIIAGLLLIYPLMILGVSLRSPMLHARVFLPMGIAIALGIGFAVSAIRSLPAFAGACLALAMAGTASSYAYLADPQRPQNVPQAFLLTEELGARNAPIIACDDFLAAAIWETDHEATIYTTERPAPMRYPGPAFWGVLEKSIIWYREATSAQIADHLGADLVAEDGFASIVADTDTVLIFRHGCDVDAEIEALEGLGFSIGMRNRPVEAADPIVIDRPNLEVLLMTRKNDPASGQP